jgi:hypothetical protein
MRQVTSFRSVRMPNAPSLTALEGVVSPEILEAARLASAELTRLRVRHVLVGGLAVGAWGWPRATRDVDFLIGPEGFERHGAIVTFAPGIPLRVGRVLVDPILYGEGEEHLEAALNAPCRAEVPIAPIEALFYMKLSSPRRKDMADLVELAKVTPEENRERIRKYVREHAPDLLRKLSEVLEEAASE